MTTLGALDIGARRLAVVFACLSMIQLSGCGYGQPVPVPQPRHVGSSGLVVSPQSISMNPGQDTTINASERGYSGTFTESDDCSGIVTIVETGGSTFQVTADDVGLCTIVIWDQNGGSRNVAVSIQSIVIGGQ